MKDLSDQLPDGDWAVVFVDVSEDLCQGKHALPRAQKTLDDICSWFDINGPEFVEFIAVMHGAKPRVHRDLRKLLRPVFGAPERSKKTLDACSRKKTLKRWLEERGIAGLLLAGLGTDRGIRDAAKAALAVGLKVGVLEDLCVGTSAEAHKKALKELAAAGALVGVYDPEKLCGARPQSRRQAKSPALRITVKSQPGRLPQGTIKRLWSAVVAEDMWIEHTPVVVGDSVIVQAGYTMARLNAETGKAIWACSVGAKEEDSGCGSMVLADTAVCSAVYLDSNVAMVEISSGKLRWRTKLHGDIHRDAIQVAGDTYPRAAWVHTKHGLQSVLHQLDCRTGKETATIRLPQVVDFLWSEQGLIVMADGPEVKKHGLFLYPPGAKTGRQLIDGYYRRLRRGMHSLVMSRSATDRHRVEFEALDAATFTSTWKAEGPYRNPRAYDLDHEQLVSAGSTPKGDRVLVLREEKTGKIVWRSQIAVEIIQTHFAGSVIAVCGGSHEPAYVVQRSNGKLVGALGTDAMGLHSKPVSVGNVLMTSHEGTLHAFQLPRLKS